MATKTSHILAEVRDRRSGRHLDFINSKDFATAHAVFDHHYVNENGSCNAELHLCTNIKTAPGRDGKPYIF